MSKPKLRHPKKGRTIRMSDPEWELVEKAACMAGYPYPREYARVMLLRAVKAL